jgi:D-glycero-D-manno-heptose 1,7-bisphosphate phosphatase
VGRGLFSVEALWAVHRRLLELLEAEGVALAGAWYCTHAPNDACGCRKPAPGLLHQAASDLHLRLEECWMIGDRESDQQAAQAAGARAVLLDGSTPDLVAAAHRILRTHHARP